MNSARLSLALLVATASLTTTAAAQEDLPCISTTWRMIGSNDKICITAFEDMKVPGVTCHISQARTGGVGGWVGWATDPSRFSIACRQTGPIAVDLKTLPPSEKAFSEKTSILFKTTNVFRIVDVKRNTLVYLATSDKVVEGSPQNSISTVPVMPWR